MKTKNENSVDISGTRPRDASTALRVYDVALLKETKEIADVLTLVKGKRPNLEELYHEMWLLD